LYHNQQLKLTNNNHPQRDSDNTSIKIADFGLAKRVHMPQSLTTLCGSLHYVAPELLKNHVSQLHLFGLFVYCSYIKKTPIYGESLMMNQQIAGVWVLLFTSS
jgi:serine/threonine protein kinase